MLTSEMLREIEVFQAADSASLKIFAQFGWLKVLSKGEALFEDKEKQEFVYFLFKGLVSIYKMNYLGEKKVIFLFKEGKMLNEAVFQSLPSSVSCEALEKSQILVIPKDVFLQAMEKDFNLTKAVMGSLAHKIRRLYRQLKNTSGSIRGDKRLAAKLWKLANDYGLKTDKGVYIQLSLSITYLADMLGSKRETVSRHMKCLAEQGLIRLEKNRIIVLDADRLAAYFKE